MVLKGRFVDLGGVGPFVRIMDAVFIKVREGVSKEFKTFETLCNGFSSGLIGVCDSGGHFIVPRLVSVVQVVNFLLVLVCDILCFSNVVSQIVEF